MKTKHLIPILLATFATAWLATASDDPTNAPSEATNAASEATNAPPDAATSDQQPATPQSQPAAPLSSTPANTEPSPTNGLVLNFHDVPLTAVLNYLSAKAGLIIVSDVNLQGKVNVVAQQPITTNDIVDVLNDQLGKNNYAAVLQGRTLTIMDAERAKTYAGTPVKTATTSSPTSRWTTKS